MTVALVANIARPISSALSSAFSMDAMGKLDAYGKLGAWSPLSLFAASEVGAWYDKSDLSTMFQDAAGTIPVTGVEQLIGKASDKSGLGNNATQATSLFRPKLSAQVNFFNYSSLFSSAAWSKANASASDTLITPTADAGVHRIAQSNGHSGTSGVISCEFKASGYNKVAFCEATNTTFSSRILDLRDGSSSSSDAINGATTITALGDGWYRLVWAYTGFPGIVNNSIWICVIPDSATGTWNVWSDAWTSNGVGGILIRNAQSQTAPVFTKYQWTTSNGVYDTSGFPLYVKYDGENDVLNSTFSASLGASCTVARSIPMVGAQILTGQTIGASYADTVNSCDLIIIDRALTVGETTNLTAYLNAKAGVV